MRSLLFVVLVLLLVVVSVSISSAADTNLVVYDANGTVVDGIAAKAVASNPVTNIISGAPTTITVQATLPSTLAIGLSNTNIAWEINKAGTYMAKAVDITATSTVTGPVKIQVSNCDHLKGKLGSLTTYYKLLPTDEIDIKKGTYVGAANFNGEHELTNMKTSIWNKIVVPAGSKTDVYSDDFVVTFSQNL